MKSFVAYLTLSNLLLAMLAAPLCSQEESVADGGWHQWRGPNRDGKLPETELGDSLEGENLKQLWRVPLGPSYSGPIVIADRVFVTETKDRKQEVVRALDRETGEQIWEATWDGAMTVPFFAKANGDWIRATPAYDEGKLYVASMIDMLICLDAKDGSELWKIDFKEQTGANRPAFGLVCSPLVDGDFVYIQAGGGFTKIEKATGKIVWQQLKDKGGMYGGAFSSPVLAEVGGKRQFLVQTREELCGVDPLDGKVLWRQAVPAFRGMNILTPTVQGDSIFTSSYRNKSFVYEVKKSTDGFSVTQKWGVKAAGYMSSPIIIDGHVYLHLQNQRFTCIDLSNGETKWTSEPFGKYWSLVTDKDRILALDERGELLLIKATPEKFELLSSRKISDQPTWAHLAVDGNEVFVRELKAISAFELKNKR